MLVLIGMCFSNVFWLMALLAPEINRELGILEGLQSVLLLAILYLVGRRVAVSEIRFERAFFVVALLGSLFMLLEELDYGTHYWWVLNSWDTADWPTLSAHNINDDAYLDYYKKGGDVLMTLWFVILPLGADSHAQYLGGIPAVEPPAGAGIRRCGTDFGFCPLPQR